MIFHKRSSQKTLALPIGTICSHPLFKLLSSFLEISITDRDVIFFCLIDLQRLFEGSRRRKVALSQSYPSLAAPLSAVRDSKPKLLSISLKDFKMNA